ncbi:MAG: FkbM family methyltransferase [Saprospiraceae bacterium]|nr:FkbM family methyltransferase [Saprospiraceae bacterium]
MTTFRGWLGILRSRAIYYWKPGNLRRMRLFYQAFIQTGDLCFDLGAHLGNRTTVWRQLGAIVVAVEPQPRCVEELQRRFAEDTQVTILPAAITRHSGSATLHINSASPTISTLRDDAWQSHMARFSSRNERWDECIEIPTCTLEDLIREYGLPAFCKIDIEGSELDVLRGLLQPLPHLSIEFFSEDLQEAFAVLDRLEYLGTYVYNYSLREQHRMQFSAYQSREKLVQAISNTRSTVISGDIYAKWVNQ